ncbi:hypothetical protein F4861DRAFT_182481 [Xylaria intraflava]|nr:hypothetical protein F4861DRAFT_182481 [Xylaria intraflava]
MDDILLAPPERGPFLGKSSWKPRCVVIGPLLRNDGSQQNLTLTQVLSSGRVKDAAGRSSKSLQKAPVDGIYFSMYKLKVCSRRYGYLVFALRLLTPRQEEIEPIFQHSITSITDCQVQQLAHRKHSKTLPTLVVQVSPDPATDKLRKRRSSRTGGLTTTRDAGPTTLQFLAAEDSKHSLDEWARYIQALIQWHQSIPTSPTSTASSGFMSQLPPTQDADEPPSTKGKLKLKLQPKSSGGAYPPSRDPSSTYNSGSPSLRSHKSNLSSQASSMVPAALNFVQQYYPNVQHPDLPSPSSAIGEHPEQFIEGWTTAQGRSSALSSPIRGRGSISSNDVDQPSLDASPLMAPRETILDRAFQMRYIPGSEREIAGEEKLTSLARFEALMRETESHRQSTRDQEATQTPLRSTWDYESDDDEYDRGVEEAEDEDSDNYAFEHDTYHDEMDQSSSRARQFITDRHSSIYSEYGLSALRPHTANSRSRPTAQRTNSQPYIPSPQLNLPSSPPTQSESIRRSRERRRSTYDSKSLSFNDFSKRLSGASSLLIVQSNVSAGSNRGSSDFDTQHTPRGSVGPEMASQIPNDRDDSCRWRGGIGVFGDEGGFL